MSNQFLVEFKAAQLVMKGGNLEQSQFRELIEEGDAFFWDGEKRDYSKCPYAGKILDEYPGAFLCCEPSDLKSQAALHAKCAAKNLVLPKNRILAGDAIKFASIALRESLSCVLVPPTSILNTVGICGAASLGVMPLPDFLQMLHDTAA